MKFFNGCDEEIIAALQYLAENPRPYGGQDRFNSEHLYQLVHEFKISCLNLEKAAKVQDTES